jgi:hypothetical protein
MGAGLDAGVQAAGHALTSAGAAVTAAANPYRHMRAGNIPAIALTYPFFPAFHPDMTQLSLPDLVGFTGAALILMLYFLGLNGAISTTGIRYPAINLLGCALVIYSLHHTFNFASFVIEVFWASISVYGIARYCVSGR